MSKKTCADCMHCQMCQWIDDMVKNSTCDFFKEWECRPHGEWIEHRTQDYFGSFHSEYECSNCHYDVWHKTAWSFCPNCGADMRKKEGDGE